MHLVGGPPIKWPGYCHDGSTPHGLKPRSVGVQKTQVGDPVVGVEFVEVDLGQATQCESADACFVGRDDESVCPGF